jgi:L-asparaginase
VNLLAAVRTAIDSKTRGLGVLVVLNDEIQAAREVTKVSTYRVNTFRTPDFGVLGQVDGDQVVIYRRPVRKHTLETIFDVAGLSELPRVDIVYAYGGADSVAIDAYIAAGARGLISAGLPPGIAPLWQSAAFEQAVSRGVIVVQGSRGGAGRVARRKYLRNQHIVAADNLNAQKARILLMLALTVTQDPEVVQSYFDLY